MPEKIRLNKYIASCGLGSRRTADELITSGVVEVNDKRINELGVSVTKKDSVKVKGKIIRPEQKTYIAFNKPPGYITSTEDEKGRKTIYDILPEKIKILKTAGRLDKDSTGLLVMTNDGELIQELTHPTKQVPKVYLVTAKGLVKNRDLVKFNEGIEIEKGKIAYAEAVIIDCQNSDTTLQITLYQGYNRQIRRMFDKVGHPVISLKRTSHACVELSGLERGKFRYISPKQVQELKNYLKKREFGSN